MNEPTKPTVLLIDDEVDFVASLEREFRLAHWEAEVAHSGAESLEFLRNGIQPDLILLDIKMPGENGLDFLVPLRKACPNACILILTGDDRNLDYVRRALKGEYCAYDYLIKPEKLPRIVARAIQEHRKWVDFQERKRVGDIARMRANQLSFGIDCIRAQSHGLGSKLLALDAYLETVIRQTSENEAANSARNLLKGANRRLARIDKYKNLAGPILAEFDLREVVTLALAEAAEEFDFHHRMKRPEVLQDLPDQPLVGYSDRALLVEVLSNFLSNAFRACAVVHERGEPCQVEVCLARDGYRAVFTVRDGGAGIPEDLLHRLGVERLTGRPGSEGLGIGLMIARRVAEMHGGEFRPQNRSSGSGAEITFSILLHPDFTNPTPRTS